MPRLWRLFVLILCGNLTLTAQTTQSRLIDPFFLIDYDSRNVHFELMPPMIETRCTSMHDHYVKAWVYGHLKTVDAEYFIVDGYVKRPSEEGSSSRVVPEEGDGFFIELHGEQCSVLPAPSVLFEEAHVEKPAGERQTIPESDLNAIAADLIQRYVKAFGGRTAFLRQISQQARGELPPVIRKQLEIFEKAR